MRKRSTRQVAKLNEGLLDAISEDFGDLAGGGDYELETSLSDRDLAGALILSGLHAWSVVLSAPPVSANEKKERKLLIRTAQKHPERAVGAVKFLTRAVIEYGVIYDEISHEFADQLEHSTPPSEGQYRALDAVKQYLPSDQAAERALARAGRHLTELREPEGRLGTQGQGSLDLALGTRADAYKFVCVAHAASVLLGPAYQQSQLAQESSAMGGSRLVSELKAHGPFRAGESEAFRILREVRLLD